MSLRVVATPPKTVLVYINFRLIQNTDVCGRLKWSWPERSGRHRRNTHSYVVHTSSRHAFELGLHSQFGMAYIRPCCYQMQFQRRLWMLQRRREVLFLKWERLRISGHLVILPCITQSTSVQNDMFTLMLTVSAFTAWKHAVIFHINKTSCLILYPGKTNIKTSNLS